MDMHIIDQSIIFLYFFINVLIGFWFALERRGAAEEFISAKGSMSGWVLGLSMVVTYMSSIGFIACTGSAFSGDWSAFAFEIPLILIVFLSVKYFVPFHRKNDEASSFTYLGKRFGPWATIYALVMHCMTAVIRMGIMLFLVAKALAFATGWSEMHIIFVVGIVTTVYTCSGGLKSVIWTDALQFVIIMTGCVLILGYLIGNIPGGVGGFVKMGVVENKFSLGDFSLSISKPNFWVCALSGVCLNLYWYGVSPSYVQRYIAARSEKEAKRAMVWSGVTYGLMVTLFFAIGTALYVYYKTHPELFPSSLTFEQGDSAYAYFIANQLPVGLKGLMIAAVLAAAMSSIDSTVNCLSMLYLVNVHLPYINPNPGRHASMRLLYASSAVVGLSSIAIALFVRNQTTVLDAWYLLSALFTGGALGIFILGVISRRVQKPAVIAGVIVGTLFVVWTVVSPYMTGSLEKFANPFHSFMASIISNVLIVLVGLVWTTCTSLKKELEEEEVGQEV